MDARKMRLMRIGVAALVVAVLFGGLGCGSDSPAGRGGGRNDGGAGSGGNAPVDASNAGAGGAPVDAAGGGGTAGGSGGSVGDAAGDPVADASADVTSDARRDDGADAQNGADAQDAADAPSGADASDAAVADSGCEPMSMACVAPGACDPFDPSSCGAKMCAVGFDGNTTCVTGVASPKGLGAACASREECAGGLDCVRIGNPTATCQRMCPRGSLGFCGGEYRCTTFLAGCVQYCRLRDIPCDIYAQNCADPAMACTLSVDGETSARYTGCRPAGTAARGDRCDQGATCAKGLLCVREGSVSTCRQICMGDAGALPCLAAGETCSGLTSAYQITYCR
jgi:hypothetical protein